MIFSFPASLVEEPLTYSLVKDFDLSVNILRAKVMPRESGRMVVELKGDAEKMEQAFEYLKSHGVTLDTLVQEMRYWPDRCVQCTACTAICPTGALSANPETRELIFDDLQVHNVRGLHPGLRLRGRGKPILTDVLGIHPFFLL